VSKNPTKGCRLARVFRQRSTIRFTVASSNTTRFAGGGSGRLTVSDRRDSACGGLKGDAAEGSQCTGEPKGEEWGCGTLATGDW
jgi:hypothetical protein